MFEVGELEKEIVLHDKLYWDENNPKITDQEYDSIIKRLKELDPENPLLSKINTPIASVKKIVHKNPMLSLDKVYDIQDLLKWCDKVARDHNERFLIEVKYDGCSANYEDGFLATRGDGAIGENISDKLAIIEILSDENNVRGEILFTKQNFEKYKSSYKKKDGSEYSNPRNACAGILNRDDNSSTAKILTLVPFDYVQKDVTLQQIKTTVDFKEMIRNAQNSDMPADGLVIKLADLKYKESLGFTAHHAKGEIAFKFANESVKTTLLKVIWSCGKEVITPVGCILPIELGGVTIKNVSLHNMKFILDNNIHIGDILTIERAGDVIPHVIDVESGDSKWTITIENCPVCNSAVIYDEPNIKCTNENCVGMNINRLYDSITRLGIERIGKPTVTNMIDILGVHNLIDIFHLRKDDLLKLPKFGEKKAQNTLNEIQKVQDDGVYEWQILAAINIPGIGRSISKVLSEKFGIADLIEMCHSVNCIRLLCNVDGIDEKRAEDIQKGVNCNTEYLANLFNILPLKGYATADETLPTICLSGKFPEKKAYYYEILKGKYVIVNTVTKELDVLVVADLSKHGSKQRKAEKMGINVMTIDALIGG